MLGVGADVGGTHTDVVLFDDSDGTVRVRKVPTTADDFSAGTIEAVLALAADHGVEPGAIDHFMHGTTVATNIALEHSGARTGLITTHGFRDILHIGRHKRPQTFSLQLDLPWQKYPLVPRRWRKTVRERIVPPGDVEVPLDEPAVRAAVRALLDDDIEAIAICFLHAYLNPEHEQVAARIVREEAPAVFVSTSHGVVPQYREYERFSTTALNAYVGPKTSRYLGEMAKALREAGSRAGIHLMQSSGGAATLAGAQARPVNLLMSGPAGGLIGGIWVGRSAGFDNVITLDVGGTSADIGVAPGGKLLYKHILDTRIGAYHAMVPMAELDAIGAGGGSIAYIDDGGQFQVGPRSAGADPGPCCYGRGGTEPTATDCLVALGWIDPTRFLGGRVVLDRGLAETAIARNLAEPLGMSVADAASGAIRILTHSMVQACEINSVRRGYDPRDFALVAFGGAGPLFACEIAREMAIPDIVVPPLPGLTSAIGLLASDVVYEQGQTVMLSTDRPDDEALRQVYGELERQIAAQLREDGFSQEDIAVVRLADCRYAGQGYELRTPVPSGAIGTTTWQDIRYAFDGVHERQFGAAFADTPVQIVNCRVVGTGHIASMRPAPLETGPTSPGPPRTVSDCLFFVDGETRVLPTPRFDRAALRAGCRIEGPAIVDQMDTTTVIPPDFGARVDAAGNIVLKLRGAT